MNKDELKEKVVDYASKVFFYCVKRKKNLLLDRPTHTHVCVYAEVFVGE